MPMPPTKAAIDAIARNPNVTAAIEQLAVCYAESMHKTTRTNAMIRAEDEVLSSVGKAWWGKALADGWIAEPICRDTEADAGVCEPHRDVCDNWSAAFPISAPDGVCGGDVVVMTDAR